MAKTREMLVGGIFVLALVILGFLTVVIGNVRWPWTEKATVRVEFENIEGLKKGDEVRVRGMQIGRVAALEETKASQTIIVALELDREIQLYGPNDKDGKRGYSIQVRSVSPLGGRYVAIFPGDKNDNEIQITAETVLSGSAVGDPLAEAAEVLVQLRAILSKAEKGEGTLGLLLTDRQLADNIRTTVQSARNVASDLEAGKGTLGRLLRDEQLADKMTAMVDSIHTVVSNIEQGKGTLGKLATDETLYDDAASAVASVKTIMADVKGGKGTLGRLYTDEKLYDNVANAMEGLGGVGKSITEGKGLLGRLVNDPQLADDVTGAFAALKESLGSIKEGNGTLGMLIKDKTVYDKIDALVTNLNDLVEDFRDQAPVSLFTSLLTLGL